MERRTRTPPDSVVLVIRKSVPPRHRCRYVTGALCDAIPVRAGAIAEHCPVRRPALWSRRRSGDVAVRRPSPGCTAGGGLDLQASMEGHYGQQGTALLGLGQVQGAHRFQQFWRCFEAAASEGVVQFT